MGVISATENEFAMHLVVRGQHRVRFPFYCYAPTAYPCIVNALLLLPIADRKRGWGRGLTVYPKESGFGRAFSYAESKIFGQAFLKGLRFPKAVPGRPSQWAKSLIPEGTPQGDEFAK